MADISKKSYMSKSNLELYDAKLKEEMTSLDVSVLTNAKSYTDKELQDFASEVDTAVDTLIGAIDGKSDKEHTHTVDSALSATSTNPVQNKVVNSALDAKVPITRTVNGKALTSNITLSASDVGADTSGSASKVQSNLDVVEDRVDDHIGNSNIHFTATERTKLAGIAEGANKYSHPSSGVTAGTYKSVTVNSQGHVTSGSNPTTLAGYGITDAEAKGTVNTHNTNSSAHNDIRIALSDLTTKVNNFLDADDTTTDQLSELIALINANKTSIETITSGKVNVSDIVNNLTTNVSNKPLSAAQGVSLKALIDALDGDKVDKVSGKGLSTNDYTTAEKNKLSGIASGAEVNQNAFSNVVVGTTTISADSKTDSLVLVGDNVTITPDATNDKVTFSVANGTTSAKGLVQLTDSTSSTSTTTAATPNSVKSAYDLANTAKTNAATAQSKADSAYDLANTANTQANTNKTNLSSHIDNKSNPHSVTKSQVGLGNVDNTADANKVVKEAGTLTGLTASVSELNYVDGVTSAIQTQLNNKANDFSIEIYNGTGGNPKPVRFASFNYSTCNSENGIAAKISLVSGHGNGSSYAFLQDAIIKVAHTGSVSVDNFKYYGADTGTYDGANRQYGDIFWLHDETNKIVDFYCLMGQYARVYQTPWKRLTHSSGGTVTQHTSCTVYSSGTKAWANNSEIALLSDLLTALTDYLPLTGGTITGDLGVGGKIVQGNPSADATVASMNRLESDLFIEGNGSAPNNPRAAGFYLGKSATDANRHLDIVSGETYSYIDFNKASRETDYDVRLLVNVDNGDAQFMWGNDSALNQKKFNVVGGTLMQNGVAVALQNQIPTVPSTHSASAITAGTFGGQVVANSSGQAVGTSLLRNSKLVSADTNPTVNGEINWTYK